MKRLRRVRVLGSLLGGVVLGLLLAILIGVPASSLGASPVRILNVLSGSMDPAIATGDAVVVKTTKLVQANVGDVITFRDPQDDERLITHRLRQLQPEGDLINVVTKGDANNAPERWSMRADGQVGLVQQRLPRMGFVLAGVRSPWGSVLLLIIPALLLLTLELRRIWLPRPSAGAASRAA